MIWRHRTKSITMSDLFKSGDIVCAKVNPTKSLKVRIFARKVHHCDVYN